MNKLWDINMFLLPEKRPPSTLWKMDTVIILSHKPFTLSTTFLPQNTAKSTVCQKSTSCSFFDHKIFTFVFGPIFSWEVLLCFILALTSKMFEHFSAVLFSYEADSLP